MNEDDINVSDMSMAAKAGAMNDSKIHMRPLDNIEGFDVRPGFYEINGATAIPVGVNFTLHSNQATSCELLLFHRNEDEPYAVIPIPEKYRIGNVWSMIVFGLDIESFEYAYRLDGPYNVKKGQLFDKSKIILDPYAKAITGQSVWGSRHTGIYKARVVKNNFDWGDSVQPRLPMDDLVIYELHVRGFTKDPFSGVIHNGTFAGVLEKLPYLKELGVTAIELMPIFEFDEMLGRRDYLGRELMDYWGYNTVGFFAPNTSYNSVKEEHQEGTELKGMIRLFHENGIEVILDVVFNHTAEGNENGPFFCFKGLDNNIYYMLTPEGYYYNFSGCGNTFNCNHPIVQQMIVDCLRYWVTNYHIDGFRFDLATILGRNEDGSPMDKPPLLQTLAYDPVLGKTKLIAEAWDAGGMYQVGSFPSWGRWAEWNGKYRDSIRSFLKGDYWAAPDAVRRITGSMDMYGNNYAGYDSSINFITCHDGFSLYDMFAYNEKHNEANGWNNTDGANDNRSWNCGAEGETDNEEVNNLRFKMMRNAISVLMCSRGTPMILQGDEFANTQYGNNNAYCQDNEISWLNWELHTKNKAFFDFYRDMIQFRRKHPAIRKDLKPAVSGLPHISVFTDNPFNTDINDNTKIITVMYAGFVRKKGHDDIVIMSVNSFWEDIQITLPTPPDGAYWTLVVDTAAEDGHYFNNRPKPLSVPNWRMKARSVSVFIAAYGVEYGR